MTARRPARRTLALALAALASASCGVPLMTLPSGPGLPASDAASALDQAAGACRAVRTLTAEIGVSGFARGHRVRGRLSAGVAAPASARLEAVAPFGPPLFIFVATGDDAALLLPRDNRALEHGRPDEVLDAIAGVPLGASDLRATITGCAFAAAPEAPQARQVGENWRIVPSGRDGELYVHRESAHAPWRLVAVVARGGSLGAWRAEYRDFQNDLPRAIRVTSIGSPAFDLELALSQVEINVPLDSDVFRVRIPASATPITLDDLRRSGPLAAKSDDQ